MSIFIDIHTHQRNLIGNNSISIRSVDLSDESIPKNEAVSAGWHPWHINNYSLAKIEAKVEQASILNRAIDTPLDLQIEVLKIHLKIASKVNKPLIVHCVKAYSDIANLLKKYRFTLPVIFHAYNGNKIQTAQLLSYNSFFSVGNQSNALLSIANQCLANIPVDRLFLETDDSDISIENQYLRASEKLQVTTDELKKYIEQNFITIFGNELVKPY
jgi:TatD DNase family protein